MKTITVIILYALGILTTILGIFCFLGGPDPGAGNGHEGFTWGVGYTLFGLLFFSIGRVIADK